jgi:hypothetical protein
MMNYDERIRIAGRVLIRRHGPGVYPAKVFHDESCPCPTAACTCNPDIEVDVFAPPVATYVVDDRGLPHPKESNS